MSGVCSTAPLIGLAGARVACSHRRSVDVIIMLGLAPVVDDATSVLVWPEAFVHKWVV